VKKKGEVKEVLNMKEAVESMVEVTFEAGKDPHNVAKFRGQSYRWLIRFNDIEMPWLEEAQRV
jgi:hypothetical protein